MLRQISQLGHLVSRTPAGPVDLPAQDAVQGPERGHAGGGSRTATCARDRRAPQVDESAALFILASRPNPRYPTATLTEPEIVINPETNAGPKLSRVTDLNLALLGGDTVAGI